LKLVNINLKSYEQEFSVFFESWQWLVIVANIERKSAYRHLVLCGGISRKYNRFDENPLHLMVHTTSDGLRWVLLMLQYLTHSRNRPKPTATDDKKKILYFECDFYGWYNFGKIIETDATECHILQLKYTKFDFGRPSSGGASVERRQ